MSNNGIEVSDIIDRFLPQQRSGLPSHHLKTLHAIRRCRTAELGGHIDGCDDCGHLKVSYNSCRNRHCPKCQGLNKEMWILGQEDILLPVVYYHVVFTLPHELNLLCMYNPREMYDLLFASAWHTLRTLANDPKWIGCRTAATMILHSWSQTLSLHPHLHCIVPNGGLTQQGKWQYPKKGNSNFLYPVAAMKKIYKGYFMDHLRSLIQKEEFIIPRGYMESCGGVRKWRRLLYDKEWVVYTKKPFSGTKHVIDYLGRYSHRVAITNRRIKGIHGRKVVFEYKDYRDNGVNKQMELEGEEFIRRFCLHILPPRYRKVRHYGFIANASKVKNIRLARKSLGQKQRELLNRQQRKEIAIQRLGIEHLDQCPQCKKGRMKTVMNIYVNRPPPDDLLQKIKTQKSKGQK